LWVAEVGELDLHIRAACRECLLDLVQVSHARNTGEPEARKLVEWRPCLGEGRDPASDRFHESIARGSPAVGGSTRLGDQLCLDPFDALRQGGVAEKR
jgi:hypothetical protein